MGLRFFSLRQGDLSRAVTLLEQAVRLCQGMGRPVSFPLVAAVLGATYNLTGRSAAAMLLLAPALEQAIWFGLTSSGSRSHRASSRRIPTAWLTGTTAIGDGRTRLD